MFVTDRLDRNFSEPNFKPLVLYGCVCFTSSLSRKVRNTHVYVLVKQFKTFYFLNNGHKIYVQAQLWYKKISNLINHGNKNVWACNCICMDIEATNLNYFCILRYFPCCTYDEKLMPYKFII